MIPVEIQLEPHVAGDTWEGISSIGPVLFDGEPPGSPVVSANLCFSQGQDYPVAAKLSTSPAEGEGLIVIDDASTWSFTVPPVDPELFPLAPGAWLWRFKTVDADGIERTLYKGVQEVTF